MKLATEFPNLSIVVPGPCNCHCDFCFWKPMVVAPDYLARLHGALMLPPEFQSISLTGGEPTLSPHLPLVLGAIDRRRWRKVILTTNGTALKAVIPFLGGTVDHVNISRHAVEDKANAAVFGCEQVPTTDVLSALCDELARIGIDVTLSCLLGAAKGDILTFIAYAKAVGASAVTFRKDAHEPTLDPTVYERAFDAYKSVGTDFMCPVCRSKVQIVKGMRVVWKASLAEPSNASDKVYELVFHPNGKLTSDWAGKRVILEEEPDAKAERPRARKSYTRHSGGRSRVRSKDNPTRAMKSYHRHSGGSGSSCGGGGGNRC